jgi:hypothetical protein
MAISLTAADLDPTIIDLGSLIGLLMSSDGEQYALNGEWFAQALDQLTRIPKDTDRVADLFKLIRDLLGPPAEEAAGIVEGADWFAVRNPLNTFPTGVYLVVPQKGADGGILGVGLASPFFVETVAIIPYAYFPLVHLPTSEGSAFVLGDKDHPIQIGVKLGDTEGQFTVDEASFSGAELNATIYFSDRAPAIELKFLDLSFAHGAEHRPDTYQSLRDIVQTWVIDWLAAILVKAHLWLHWYVGGSSFTVGELLTLAGFLTVSQEDVPKYTLDTEKLNELIERSKPPLQIAEDFLFTILSNLAEENVALLSLGDGGLYVVKRDDGGAATFGARLQVPDIPIGSRPADPATAARQLLLQLGKWHTGDDEAGGWIKRAGGDEQQPGVDLYLLRKDGDKLSFAPSLSLVSVGIDFRGADTNHPLVDLKGVRLGGVEPRIYLALDFERPEDIQFGAAIRCDDVGLPLGPTSAGQSASNPVAGSLLGDSSRSGGAGQGAADTANPTYSLMAAYRKKFAFQIYDKDGKPTDTVWLPVQRAFGPLHCQKIGVGWQSTDHRLALLFDGGVTLAGLSLDLIDLAVDIPIANPTDYTAYALDLQGLALSYVGGPVEISGGLLKSTYEGRIEYDGEAMLKAENFAITALGSFTELGGGQPSLFVFVLVGAPIGGPPYFYVTGLAGGFGYNRALRTPEVDQVAQFPLVQGLTDPKNLVGPGTDPGSMAGLAKALQAMDRWIPPTRGEYWLAAGVQFTSFEVIDSAVLLAVEFGKEFEIMLLGTSIARLPKDLGRTYVYTELELEIFVKPSEGVFAARAVLTPNSYVFDPACHLTGGFAFFVWFGSHPHADDFVLTIGGYHNAFKPPDWYPQVPRLGFTWQVSSEVSIKGGAYFALTPSCVMAGGALEASYTSGDLRAWFNAHADLLIFWKPFHFSVGIDISIGVSYRLNIFGISTPIKDEIGATVALWGPPTGGTAHIEYTIISVTVAFGPGPSRPAPMTWDTFKALLPAPPKGAAPNTPPDICHILPNDGLLRQVKVSETVTRWIVRADEFEFSTESAIPATSATLTDHAHHTASYDTIAIRPMGVAGLTSLHIVTVAGTTSHVVWTSVPNIRDVPEALWGEPVDQGALSPGATLLPKRLVGLKRVKPVRPAPAAPAPPPIDMPAAFTYLTLDRGKDGSIPAYLPLSAGAVAPAGEAPEQDPRSLETIGATIVDHDVAAFRTGIFNALAEFGIYAGTDGQPDGLARNPAAALATTPMIGALLVADQV